MPVQPSKVCPGSLSFAKAISQCDATPSGQQSRTSKNHSASGSREVLMNDRYAYDFIDNGRASQDGRLWAMDVSETTSG
jgi:hypothetical protein